MDHMDLPSFTLLAEQGLVAIKEPTATAVLGVFGPKGQQIYRYTVPGGLLQIQFYWDPQGTETVIAHANPGSRLRLDCNTLMNMPRLREFAFKSKSLVGPVDVKPSRISYNDSALGFIVGQIVFPCTQCASDKANYPFCVTVRDSDSGERLFSGGCVSCKYKDHPYKCSFSQPIQARGNLCAPYVPYPVGGVVGALHHNTQDLAIPPQAANPTQLPTMSIPPALVPMGAPTASLGADSFVYIEPDSGDDASGESTIKRRRKTTRKQAVLWRYTAKKPGNTRSSAAVTNVSSTMSMHSTRVTKKITKKPGVLGSIVYPEPEADMVLAPRRDANGVHPGFFVYPDPEAVMVVAPYRDPNGVLPGFFVAPELDSSTYDNSGFMLSMDKTKYTGREDEGLEDEEDSKLYYIGKPKGGMMPLATDYTWEDGSPVSLDH